MSSEQKEAHHPLSSVRGVLRGAATVLGYGYKAAKIFLWPPSAFSERLTWAKVKKGTVNSLKATGAFAGVIVLNHVLHVGTERVFPTGEEYLKSKGLDPAIAKRLSEREIRVREHSFFGRLHAATEIPTFFGVGTMGVAIVQPDQAFAMPPRASDWLTKKLGFNAYAACMVMTQNNRSTARSTIAALGGIDEELIERVPITDRETELAVLFHEFRHCDPANHTETGLGEHDSDIHGIPMAAEQLKNPEIKKALLYARSLNISASTHDTTLALDAHLRGKPLPANAYVSQGRTLDAFNLAKIYERNVMNLNLRNASGAMDMLEEMAFADSNGIKFDKPYAPRTAVALEKVLVQHGKLLHPDAKRRAQLFIEAVEYYMPTALAGARVMYRNVNSVKAVPSS